MHISDYMYFFFRSYCQSVFDVFERAYVGKPESKVFKEDYDDLMAMVPYDHPCNQVIITLLHIINREDYFIM